MITFYAHSPVVLGCETIISHAFTPVTHHGNFLSKNGSLITVTFKADPHWSPKALPSSLKGEVGEDQGLGLVFALRDTKTF